MLGETGRIGGIDLPRTTAGTEFTMVGVRTRGGCASAAAASAFDAVEGCGVRRTGIGALFATGAGDGVGAGGGGAGAGSGAGAAAAAMTAFAASGASAFVCADTSAPPSTK